MLFALSQMDFPFPTGKECILLTLVGSRTCNVFSKFDSTGIHAEAACKFTFQTFISLCRKISCDK